MRFIKIPPKEETTRIITGFAVFPVTLDFGNRRETRWLESYRLKQIYLNGRWRAVDFIENGGDVNDRP